MLQDSLLKINGTAIQSPSEYRFGIYDVSDPDSGRTLDGVMHKNRVARKRKLELKWKGISVEQCSSILSAFSPEYVNVTYADFLSLSYETRTFYAGDQLAPLVWWTAQGQIIEELSFNIIEV